MAHQHHGSENTVRRTGEHAMKRPETPFPRHWLYYIVLKVAVIAVAVVLAMKYFGMW
jgi:hypothetical protein